MGSEVYEHKPTDADRGLDRTTPKQDDRCGRLRAAYSQALEEIRRLEQQVLEIQDAIRSLQTSPPRRCFVTSGGRRVEVPCASIAQLRADLEMYQGMLARARAELPRIRSDMELGCRPPEPPRVSSLPGATAPGQARSGRG
ncbi:MAG TPA: hypothetical protein VF103_15260 [Polyangiaceae bacterium]